MRVDGSERVGSIGGDCYVEPRVRRRGVATALHRASFAELGEAGVEFMFGAPTEHNLLALIKAGSHLVTYVECWVFPLSSRALFRAPSLYRNGLTHQRARLGALLVDLPAMMIRRFAKPARQGIVLRRVAGFDSMFDVLFERVAASHRIVSREVV
jgi:hypothetical protein